MRLPKPKYLAIALIGFSIVSCKQKEQTLFEALPSSRTNINFVNHLSDDDPPGILDYLYFYNGGGVAIGDVNNDGLPDIYFTANKKGANKLYLNKGNYQFEDIAEHAGVTGLADWCSGVTMADVNNDGWLDIYVCAVAGKLGFQGHNMLYINNHDGTFTEESAKYGLDFSGYSTQAAFFDADHDGLLDCFLLNQSDHMISMYGADTALRRQPNKLAGSKFYLNRNGHYEDITQTSGIYSGAVGYGLGISVGDVNNDGWEDIYIGNDFHENDYYYLNNHDGTFTESGAKHFAHYSRASMGNDMADFNNDGQLDLITVDMLPAEENHLKTFNGDGTYEQYRDRIINGGFQYQYSRNCLQKNMGNGEAFSDVGLMDGISATDWSWSPLLADFDDDGIKDLFIANGIQRRPTDLDYISYASDYGVQAMLASGHASDATVLANMPPGESHSYLFKGSVSGKFIDKSFEWGMKDAMLSNGAAYADLNNDGHLDIVTNNINREAFIFRNTDTSAHYLSLQFTGRKDNRFGIGVKAYIFNRTQLQYEQLMPTRGFQSSVEPKLHFGLADAKAVDSILIVWPDQTCQVIRNVKANQLLTVDQKDAGKHFVYNEFFPTPAPVLKDITSNINLNWKHKEDTYIDFALQPLLPHMLSTEGPHLAVADVNHDGLDDFFVCGGKGQPGALFIQHPDGSFKATVQPAFAASAATEGVDAAFLDVNHDGFPDLYVVSGGNELPDGSPALADHLYINDGNGNFTEPGDIPTIKQNKSAVAIGDVNHDGSPDIFVAGAPAARAFGPIPESYLLMNDGHNHYKKAQLPDELKYAGMIRSAAFADLDNDGWPDLVVAGEWMPVEVFMNEHGKLVRRHNATLDKQLGWWQRILLTDVDGDGKIDIVAGNWGWNSPLRPTASEPVKLFLSDLDHNGSIDPLLTYSINHNDYPLLGKEELEKQLPYLKRSFPHFRDFAGKTVQQLFGEDLTKTTPLIANSFTSGVFYNTGPNNFEFREFPPDAQSAPLFGLAVLNKSILAGGNFSGVTPTEGRYDADYGDLLQIDKNRNFKSLPPRSSGLLLRGEVRDIKPIETARGIVYAIAFNNQEISFFHYIDSTKHQNYTNEIDQYHDPERTVVNDGPCIQSPGKKGRQ